jgi:hypothetical protein
MVWNVTCRFVGLVDHALVPLDLKKRFRVTHIERAGIRGGEEPACPATGRAMEGRSCEVAANRGYKPSRPVVGAESCCLANSQDTLYDPGRVGHGRACTGAHSQRQRSGTERQTEKPDANGTTTIEVHEAGGLDP